MNTSPELREALSELNGGSYNVSSPHPVLDKGNRYATIARAAHKAGMSADEMRQAVRDSMDARTGSDGSPKPFPEDSRADVLVRIEAMMDLLAVQARGE
jgi:hypothetical protein